MSLNPVSLRLGAHMSISGGLHKALLEGESYGCDIVQLFSKSSQQWAARPITDQELALWKQTRAATKAQPALVHDSYLINLATPDDLAWAKAKRAFADELQRADRLQVPYLVTHPGAHMGRGTTFGVARVSAALNEILSENPGLQTQVLLETTAGQGSSLGARFEELRDILAGLTGPNRVSICIDTCHIFAAGYDIRTAQSYAQTFAQFAEVLGWQALSAFHVNDSQKPLGSRIDRHAHLGRGQIGLEAFRLLLNDSHVRGLPMSLETPKETPHADAINLAILRELDGKKRLSKRATSLAAQALTAAPTPATPKHR